MAILAALGATALVAGCGTQSHPNDPRPPLPIEVSVIITDKAVQAEPAAAGVKSTNGAALSGNRGKEPAANPNQPQIVNFTITNSTRTKTTIEIRGPGGTKTSGPLVPSGNTVFKVALESGHYKLQATDLPGAKAAAFLVGPKRVSAQNDLSLP